MKYLKWVSICLGGLIVLFAIVVGILHLIGQNNLNLAPTVTIATVNVPNDLKRLSGGHCSDGGGHRLLLGGEDSNPQ